jgi:hypothetical protein
MSLLDVNFDDDDVVVVDDVVVAVAAVVFEGFSQSTNDL